MRLGLFIFLGIISIAIGGQMAAYFFFGTLTLLGFVVLVESIGFLKWIVVRTSALLDIAIFVLTILATASLGVTITASLTVAGLGFSLLYAPWLRRKHKESKLKSKLN